MDLMVGIYLQTVPENLWQSWNLAPRLLLGLTLAAVLYGQGIAALWRQAGMGRGVAAGRVLAFALGLLVLVMALISPLDRLSEALLSAHMVQHLLLILVAAPLLIWGMSPVAAAWAVPRPLRRGLARWWHGRPRLRRLWRRLSHPGVVWALYAAAIWLWHLPRFYQAALLNETVHGLEHACFLGAALLFWWTLFFEEERRRRLSLGGGLLFVFTTALYNGLLGALLTFASRPWYPAYGLLSYAWGLSPLEDQQLAGVIMWFPAGLFYLGACLLLLGRWLYQEEKEQDGRAPAVTLAPTEGRV